MKKITVIIALLSFTLVGCTGSFNMTRKVYDWHRSQDTKWTDEVLFLVSIVLPIYGLSTFADAVVFNSIEFWTGDNPISPSHTQVKLDQNGEEGVLSYNHQTEEVTLSTSRETIVFEKKGEVVLAKNEAGEVLYSSLHEPDGGIAVYDKDLQLVKKISAGDIEQVKAKHLK